MKIVSTFHPSSSVLSSVKCRLGSRDLEHLVVAKLNRLDVYSLRPNGLQHECGLNIWGKICSVDSIPVSKFEMRSNIAVMLTHPDPEFIVLEYKESSNGTAELIVKKQLSLHERLPRIAEFCTEFLIHPSGKLAVVSCYAAKLKIITLKAGNYAQDFDLSFPEINVLSIAFLPTPEGEYTLAILYIDSQNRLQLCAREIDVPALELSPQLSTLLLPTLIPERVIPFPTDCRLHLIPVPADVSAGDDGSSAFTGGVMVVGGKDILLFELASPEGQAKQRGKQKRLEAKLNSSDPVESAQARAKEQERGFRKRKAKASVQWPWNEVTSYCTIDEAPSQFLIGDSFGRLSLLSASNVNESGMILIPLGEISSPTTLTYLTNQTLYVGSHLGDSQLVQISPTPLASEKPAILAIPMDVTTVLAGSLDYTPSRKGKEKATSQTDMDVDVDEDDNGDYTKGRVVDPQGTHINVLDKFKNIGPIMDAIAVDIDGSGQAQIVTCSGGANTGSINIVRNGADFKELAFVAGLTGITGIWSVRAAYDDITNTHILVTTSNESHLFHINDNGSIINLQREELGHGSGFVTNQPTVAFSNFRKRENGSYCDSGLVVQVVPTAAYLLEWTEEMKYIERDTFDITSIALPNKRPPEIVAASVNATQVALALSGGTIIILSIEDALKFKQLTHDGKREVSAISLMPLDAQKPFSSILAVAYWETNIVEVFDIKPPELRSRTQSPPLAAVVRSLLLYNFGTGTKETDPNYNAYLLAGLGDGSVATLSWKGKTLRDLKIISLGRAPVNLTPCEVDGKKAIFAAGNRASVFFCERNRLTNSPIVLKDILAVSKLNTRTFTSALILATPTGLSIGSVRNLNKMHIRSSFFGLDNPRKIVHEPSLCAFGVACSRIEPSRIGRYEATSSTFHLIDDNSLAHLGRFKAKSNEEIVSVASFKTIVGDQGRPFFCLGTVIYKEEEVEPTSGRLLVFTAHAATATTKTSSLELILVASAEVAGVVYSLKFVEGKIVAAVNSSVLLYQFNVLSEENQLPTYSLDRIANWNHNYLVTTLGSYSDRVIAGDQISSVSLLKVTDTQLTLEGRDFTPLYPIAVEALDTATIMAANDTLNLVLFKLGKSLRGEALERIGYFHLAEMVSKFVRGSITTPEQTKDSKLKPQMIYFTSSGSIGVITDVEDDVLSLHLTELQRNLAAVIPGVGGTSHARFRSPKNIHGPSDADGAAYGFVDGDFLEQYIGLQSSPDLMRKVMAGGSEPEKLKLSEEEILKLLEQLQSFH